ncbi:hypothetical protein [Paraburkholderia sp. BR14374]|uniref:hypothetical protein n=1 Tax=Paraburkholderia sp. BR14374 TaxID=3237007 RepID=UPI0034CF961C
MKLLALFGRARVVPALYAWFARMRRWRDDAQEEFSDARAQFRYQRTPKFNWAKKYINTGRFIGAKKKNIPIVFVIALGDIGVWLMHD